MKTKVLHIVGGASTDGAFKGADLLHKELLKLDIESKILNDNPLNNSKKKSIANCDNNIIFINKNYIKKIVNKIFIYTEKILKSFYLHSPRETFTWGFFGFDITKLKEYQDADIIHIHWFNQGFINLKALSKINKPVIWTMRDMWAFTGGAHYTMDFEKYEHSNLSKKIQTIKKKIYKKNFKFVAISDWLKNKAKKSEVLKEYDIKKIYNNINLQEFDLMEKNIAKTILEVSTKKQIILYGAQNPQSKRKGWDIFVDTLKKLDKEKYFLLIFGNFWSQKVLDNIGIEYKNLGFINDNKKLNAAYSASDFFIASSIQEAFGKTWAEALACGTPVLCFDNTSVSEIVDHKTNGYIVKNFNSSELLQGINWLSEEVKKNNFKKNQIRNKASIFDIKVIAKKYVDLYDDVLNNK